jgi:deoxyribodipyrimidine photolyase-related protein
VPGYLEQNALGCDPGFDLPSQYWSGETHMRCVREAMAHVLQHGYAHHIERLMVLGLFALLLGVYPRKFHDWHMAMYLDAVDWASAPNALGMSQYADGGVIASKPYVASGKYVQRMSNFCGLCRYDPDAMLGSRACPLTTLYWDFLQRHRDRFKRNRRMALQVANVDRKDRGELASVRRRAEELRSHADVL